MSRQAAQKGWFHWVLVVEAVFLPQIVLVVAGACAGVGLSAVSLRTARALLYGLSPFDPVSYMLAFGIVMVASLLAALGPISSSIKIDPFAVLRSE